VSLVLGLYITVAVVINNTGTACCKELACVPVFSEAQGMPGMQADFITGDDNWARTDIEAKLNTCVHQTERHKITSTFILAIVHNQTWTGSNKCDISQISTLLAKYT